MKYNRWPAVATVLSLLACYGTLITIAALGAMGFAVSLNEGLWAGAIVFFAALALLALVFSGKRHGASLPVAIGALGFIAVSYTMLVDYSRITELFGFVLLAVAAWLDWRRS